MSLRAATIERLFAAMQGAKGFPALENTVTSVIEALRDEQRGHRDVVHHLVEDFSLTQKVLKLANSAMYAPFSQGASNLSSAVDVLGPDALLHMVLSTAMVTDQEMESDGMLSKTRLSSELARNVCADRSEDVSIAALMYDLGRLVLQKYLPQEAAAIEAKVAAGMQESEASTALLGLTLQQLGAEVAARWKLPASIVSVIDGSGDPDLVAIARFSSTASALIHAGKLDDVERLIAALEVRGVDKSGLGSLVRRKVESIKPVQTMGATPSREAVLNALFDELAANRKQTIEGLGAAMFPTISATLGTAHCLLFMLTRTGDYAVRYGYGKGIDELRSRLRISKDYKPTAFHAAVKNNVDVSISDVSRLKASALPDGYAQLLPQISKFVILPIATSRVSGLFYCDWDTETMLSPPELEAVKRLRGLFLPLFPA